MELIPGYRPTHLWVPVSYRSVRVFAPLPAEIRSWVRVSADSRADGPTATFDVTLCDRAGTVLVAIEGFAIRRLGDAGFGPLRPPTAAEVEFVRSAGDQPLSASEKRLAHNLSQGIRPQEGADAFARALALGEPQVVVSSLDLRALVDQAGEDAAVTPKGGQDFERPDLETPYVEPRNDIERMLAGFWQELLGIERVGVEDSFFDLGGHSLIAVRLFVMIKKAYRVEFPISVLFEAPTIATCAALIAERLGIDPQSGEAARVAAKPAERRYKHLVAMHQGEARPGTPFFLVAGMFGNVLNLRHLAHLLGTDRPFYGLQARGLYGDEEPHRTFEEAAADHIAELRTVQPHGPYLLGGFSGGGITAYEMARQLEAEGERVALLVMLDTPLPMRPDAVAHRSGDHQVARAAPRSGLHWALGPRPAGLGAREAARPGAGRRDADRRRATVPRPRDRGRLPRRPAALPAARLGRPARAVPARPRSPVAGVRRPLGRQRAGVRLRGQRLDAAGRRGRASSRCRATTTRWSSSRTSACSPPGCGPASRRPCATKASGSLSPSPPPPSDPMPEPTVLTVVLNYRTPRMTLEAVEAAYREMAGIAGEIVVVDNNSRDGSFETMAAAISAAGWDAGNRVRAVASKRNGGYGAGNNVGIRAGLSDGGRPDYVYILNSDAFPDPGAIRALVDYLEEHPEVGFAGSYIHGPDGEPHTTAFRFPTFWSEFEGAARVGPISRLLARRAVAMPPPETRRPVDWIAGASVMMRRTMLDAIGIFDESFFLYFDETDLCRRGRTAGWLAVYVRESSVTHLGSVSTGMRTWSRTPSYWFNSRLRYFMKHHGVLYAAAATIALVAGGSIWRVRMAVQGLPPCDPPHFLRDLLVHAVRACAPRTRRAPGAESAPQQSAA